MDTGRRAVGRADRGRGAGALKTLLDAVVTMAADPVADELLERIVEVAADLAGARYAAPGVVAEGGQQGERRLQTFITHGITCRAAGRDR